MLVVFILPLFLGYICGPRDNKFIKKFVSGNLALRTDYFYILFLSHVSKS